MRASRREIEAILEAPVLAPHQTLGTVTEDISSVVLTRPLHKGWIFGFLLALGLLMVFFLAITVLFVKGVGIWGVNIPVAWAFAITNFVWWIGIGHAGTLISAFLLLLRQQWRTSINRFAEAMTLFAVMCAGLFPLLHLGRPWVFYWLFPYPNSMRVWPQFRSPLMWDIFAVSTYFIVSLLFWYLGLIPDLATMRDRAQSKRARVSFGIAALGWRNSARHWNHYELGYLLLAGLATPLVISVHSVVSFDFSVAQIPGWHSTIFPPYFVAGAIYSGFAMVLTLAIPIRKFYGLEKFLTTRHLNNMAKVMLANGLIVAYGYAAETFMAFYSGNLFERDAALDRFFGAYAPVFWGVLLCNVLLPQLLWFPRVRAHIGALFALSLVINLGMWLERFMIIVGSLHRGFMPSAWRMYAPTFWDYATLFGSFGLFFTMMLLFLRFIPMVSMSEMRQLVTETEEKKV